MTSKKELLELADDGINSTDAYIIASTIDFHFRGRGRVQPTVEDGLLWMVTEIGECFELWSAQKDYKRNNPDDKEAYSKERFGEELGDVVYMAIITGLVAGVNPLAAIFLKMKKQIEKELEENNDK